MISAETASGVVLVPVSAEHLQAVYALLAQRMDHSTMPAGPSEGVEVIKQGRWAEDMVIRLKSAITHLPAARQLLDAAASPDEVSMKQFALDAGVDRHQLRAQMGTDQGEPGAIRAPNLTSERALRRSGPRFLRDARAVGGTVEVSRSRTFRTWDSMTRLPSC